MRGPKYVDTDILKLKSLKRWNLIKFKKLCIALIKIGWALHKGYEIKYIMLIKLLTIKTFNELNVDK